MNNKKINYNHSYRLTVCVFRKIFSLPLIILLFIHSIFFASHSFAYIFNTSIFKNEKNQLIFIGGDHHSLGTVEENELQFNFIKEEIFDFFEKKNIPIKIFYEDMFMFDCHENSRYRLEFYRENLQEFVRIFNFTREYYFKLQDYPEYTTWLFHKIRKLLTFSTYDNIYFESIDPRLSKAVWGECDISSLKDLVFHNSEIKSAITNNPNHLLSKELQKYNDEIIYDLAKIISILRQNSSKIFTENFNDIFKFDIFELSQKNLIDLSLIDLVRSILKKEPELFTAVLDRQALWSISNSTDNSPIFLFVGNAHKKALSASLMSLGYREIPLTNVAFKDFDHFNHEKMASYLKDTLEYYPGLKTSIEANFLLVKYIILKSKNL